jgi:non-heme chloroperoxidase
MKRIVLLALVLFGLCGVGGAHAPYAAAKSVDLQEAFDPLGPRVHSLDVGGGRTAHYVDEGKPGWRPVVFLSGHGTSARAFGLTEFARTSREALKLRVISVERNGFGESPFDPGLGYEEYVDEVLAVLDHLGVDRFAVMAISGGGPYATYLTTRAPSRVISLHIAAAIPNAPQSALCGLDDAALQDALRPFTENPKLWWGMPASSPIHLIRGWQETAYEEAGRTFFVGGQLGAPDALAHERRLYCTPTVPDLSEVTAPAYLYWGAADQTVPLSQMERWRDLLPNVAAERVYEGEGHDVQYRHWDQILVDMAGLGDQTVICHQGRTRLVDGDRAERFVSRGATLGICAWAAD